MLIPPQSFKRYLKMYLFSITFRLQNSQKNAQRNGELLPMAKNQSSMHRLRKTRNVMTKRYYYTVADLSLPFQFKLKKVQLFVPRNLNPTGGCWLAC